MIAVAGSVCTGSFLQCVTDGQAVLIQTGVLIAGGAWALFLYWRRRESQATVRITPDCRLEGSGERRVLLVGVQFENASRVALRRIEASLAVFAVSGPYGPDGRLNYLLWRSVADLLLEVEGNRSFVGPYVVFKPSKHPTIWEPGERVATEAALPDPPSQLLAVMIEAFAPRSPIGAFFFRLRRPRAYGLRLWRRSYWAKLYWEWSVLRFVNLEEPRPPVQNVLPPPVAGLRDGRG